MQNTSSRFSLNAIDIWKALRGLLVILAGTALTWVSQNYLNFDYGSWTPVVTAVLSTGVELGRRWLSAYK